MLDPDWKEQLRRTQIAEAKKTFAERIATAEKEGVFGGFADNVIIPYVLLGWSGLILEANAAARRLLLSEAPTFEPSAKSHRPSADQPLFIRPLADFISQESRKEFLKFLQKCRESARHCSVNLTLEIHGRMLPARLVSEPMIRTSSQPLRFKMVILDNSPRFELERNLEHVRHNFQKLMDASNGVLWEADFRTGRTIFIGQGIEQLLDYPRDMWLQDPHFWENHIYSEDRQNVLHSCAMLKRFEKAVTLEYRMIRADRKLIWVRKTVVVQEEAGQLIMRGILVDITRTKTLEEQNANVQSQLEDKIAERTAELRRTISELEAFSYSLSHDMRAPLRAMFGFSELLLHDYGHKVDDIGRDFLVRIQNSSKRLDRLVCDVLNYSRLARAPVELEKINPEMTVDQIVYERMEFQRPRAEIEVLRPLLPLIAHEAFLYQILFNLLDNAVKFVPPETTPHVRVWTEQKDDHVRLWVKDNGIGIDREQQKKLFTLFTRLNSNTGYEGTGIGLAIVRKAVERMHGEIGLESEAGKGTKFWIKLPRAE